MKSMQTILKHAGKSLTLLVLVLVILLSTSPTALAALSKAELENLAYQYAKNELGYAKESLDLKVSGGDDSEGGLSYSFLIRDADPSTDGQIWVTMTKDGKLKRVDGPMKIPLYSKLHDELLSAQRSYQAVYELAQKWKPILRDMSDEERANFDSPGIAIHLLNLINHDICLPSPDDISYEDAKKKAEASILASPGWTQEMLNHIRIGLEVYHVPSGSDRPVYQFVYSLASSVGHLEALYSGKSYSFDYDKEAKEEDRIFGKALPYNVNVRIDAQTGSQVGDIYIDTPPTKYADLEFILWKWDGTP